MKRPIFFSLGLLLSLLVGSAVHAQAAPSVSNPFPTFSCGPYMQTYVVHSLVGWDGLGIRCVKMSDGSQKNRMVPALAWYGEGNWGTCEYRHVGQAYIASKKSKAGVYQGFSSDIMGNGECGNGNYPGTITLTVVDDQTIRVTGAWNEEWKLVDQVNYTPLPTPTTCGRYFDEYKAFSISDGQVNAAKPSAPTGQGLRCVLKVGPRNTTWIGFGQWQGQTYSHLATGSTKGYGSSDFCRSADGFCADFIYGTIRRYFKPSLHAITVDGWNEWWQKKVR